MPIPENLQPIRKSAIFLNEAYFWTNTIDDWKTLLADDYFKHVIIDSWKHLVDRKKINIYGFVIMPNHVHILWEMLAKNGKELPHVSFNKFTAHQFLNHLTKTNSNELKSFYKPEVDREHRFWRRDPLAVHMFSREVVEQKIDYIHNNPLQEKWNLADRPENYRWSSANFYEKGEDEFGIITHYMERFG